MLENATNARIAAAHKKAHAERARAFVGFFSWLFTARDIPLGHRALTEPSR